MSFWSSCEALSVHSHAVELNDVIASGKSSFDTLADCRPTTVDDDNRFTFRVLTVLYHGAETRILGLEVWSGGRHRYWSCRTP